MADKSPQAPKTPGKKRDGWLIALLLLAIAFLLAAAFFQLNNVFRWVAIHSM